MMKNRIVTTLGVAAILALVLAAPAFARSGAYWSYTVDNAATHYDNGVLHPGTGSLRDTFAISGKQSDYPGGHVPTGTFNNSPIYYVVSDGLTAGLQLAAPGDQSPHKNYTTTSGKCKVCHAVHGAGLNATNTVGGIRTEKLLRTPANEACEFCHITNNFGGIVYASLADYNSGATGSRPSGNSGHMSSHRSAATGYAGCKSCHAVHGANTIAGSAILKNDPAQGVTSVAAVSAAGLGTGWGAYQDPVSNQKEFCVDCHGGVARYSGSGATTAVIAQLDTLEQFSDVFQNCSTQGSPGSCHTSVQQNMESHNEQFGVSGTTARNGRSHIMTTTRTNASGITVAWGDSGYAAEGPTSAANGCATCHNSNGQNTAAWTKFPHLVSGQDLITGYNQVTQIDGVCVRCHGGADATYGTSDGGVGEGF